MSNPYSADPQALDAKLAEFTQSIEDADLRWAVGSRLKRNAHLVVGALLVNDATQICLVQEAAGPWAGKWNLPIGHLEHNEKLLDGAKREIKEESGYEVELTELLPLLNASCENVFLVVYVGRIVGGAPEQRDPASASTVGWFTLGEIEQKMTNDELRDDNVWRIVSLYQTGRRLALDAIQDIVVANE